MKKKYDFSKGKENPYAKRRGERIVEALDQANADAKQAGTDRLSDTAIQAEIDAVRRKGAGQQRTCTEPSWRAAP